MPGAKKLELGRHSVPGWFTLRHQERSLYRCKLCFRRANISLVREARCFYPYCHSCLVLQRTTEGKEGRTAEKRNWSFETKIPILETIVSAFQ